MAKRKPARPVVDYSTDVPSRPAVNVPAGTTAVIPELVRPKKGTYTQPPPPGPSQPETTREPTTPAPPAGPSWQQGAGPFAGKGAFTSDNPLQALQLAGAISWVAVMPQYATPEVVQKLRAAGIRIIIWEGSATPQGVATAAAIGADGYIAQAEGPGQLQAALSLQGQLGAIPKALVTNNFMPVFPAGWVAMPEAYTNTNTPSTVAAVVNDSLTRGATTVVPIIGTYDATGEKRARGDTSSGQYDPAQYLRDLAAAGATNFGAFSVEAMSAGDIATFRSGTAPTPAGGVTGVLLPDTDITGRTGTGLYGVGPSTTGAAPGTTPGGVSETPIADDTTDWSQYLDIFGLPNDVKNYINNIFRTTQDVTKASALAISYIRGTPWYSQTYPGITEGRAKGIISDERAYRAALNQVSELYRRYYGREIGGEEFANYLREGVGVDTIGRRLQGEAVIKAQRPELQFALGGYGEGQASEEELTAFGRQQAGLSSTLGASVQQKIERALTRLQGVFGGQLATPGLSLSQGRLTAPGFGASEPDISA